MDASNLLKPMLARGELHCIGATTLDEYRKHIEKDAALERRFQPVLVDQPTRRGHDLDPARPARALRSPPRRAHQGQRPRRRRGAVASLHHRPLPARQGDRPRRRGRRQAAHRDRLDAGRARRGVAPRHAARDRARSAQEGNRHRLARPPGEAREGARASCSEQADALRARWQREKERDRHAARAARADRRRPSWRSSRPSASTTSTAPPSSSTASCIELEKQLAAEEAQLQSEAGRHAA